MKRNRERVANLGAPSQNSAISLPFLVVNTGKKTTIDCSISSDKYVCCLFRFLSGNFFACHLIMPLNVDTPMPCMSMCCIKSGNKA